MHHIDGLKTKHYMVLIDSGKNFIKYHQYMTKTHSHFPIKDISYLNERYSQNYREHRFSHFSLHENHLGGPIRTLISETNPCPSEFLIQ